VNDTPRAYANGDRRRADKNDTRPFPANDTSRVYPNDVRDSDENIVIATPLRTTQRIPVANRKVQNVATIPHTTEIPNTIGKHNTTDYNVMICENKSAPAATTSVPQINKNTKLSDINDDQHATIRPTTSLTTRTTTPKKQTKLPADETHQTKPQEHEPQLTMAVYSQNQDSMSNNKSGKHTIIDCS